MQVNNRYQYKNLPFKEWIKDKDNYLGLIFSAAMLALFVPNIVLSSQASSGIKRVRATYNQMKKKGYITIKDLDKNKNNLHYQNPYSDVNYLKKFNDRVVVDQKTGKEYLVHLRKNNKYDLIPNTTSQNSYIINSAWQEKHNKFN